jgi:hypothetical protein
MYLMFTPLNICDTCLCSSCYRKGHTIIVSSFDQLWSAKCHTIIKKKLNLYTIRHNHWTFWLKFLQVSTAWSVFELHPLCFAPHKTQCTRRFDISSGHINHRFICTPSYRQSDKYVYCLYIASNCYWR